MTTNEKVAIVTGGTGALGSKVVEKFAGNGIKVYVPSLTIENFNEVFDSSHKENEGSFRLRKIFSFICNATDENSVADFVKNVSVQEKGKIDYLINTVGGISSPQNIDEITSEELNKMLDLNFKSAFYFTRETLRIMKQQNYGRIVSIGGIAGLSVSPGRFSYSVSKAAVINLMDTAAEEMKDYNIRCNTVIPGIMDTPANREWGTDEEIRKWVSTDEIANIIFDLVSNDFSSVRGSHIKAYGGL